MTVLFKIIVYLFSLIGLCVSTLFAGIYVLMHYKIVDEKVVLTSIQRYTKIDFSTLCKPCDSKVSNVPEVAQKPHNIWVIENMDSEQAAKSLLSLTADEIVKYLVTIDREKSLKILEGMYAVLEEQGEEGKKRKQEIDKKLFGGVK